jgi:hypothetical protein
MRYVAGYWLIGCLFAGNVIGLAGERCEDVRKASMVETLAFVAIWPAALPLMFYHWPKSECLEVQPVEK